MTLSGVNESDIPNEQWYSDSALEKQREMARRTAAGERIDVDLMLGILQPRVEPTSDETCPCCGLDARPEVGGDGSYCSICIGRGHNG